MIVLLSNAVRIAGTGLDEPAWTVGGRVASAAWANDPQKGKSV
ncbi:hypothetical protein [Kitasatospora sp. LaBMicrA B282]